MPLRNLTSSFIQGQAVVQFGFRLDENAEITPVIAEQVIVDNGLIVEKINEPASHQYQLITKGVDFADKVLHAMMQDASPSIQVRLGMVSGDDSIFLPWQEHQITFYRAIPNQDGHSIRLDTYDRLYSISRSDQKVRARRGLISTIVSQIANENGLQSAIETTKSNGGEIYIQSYMDDVEFIVKRLIPRAINEKGRGNYRLFIKDNILHFHSPDFQTEIRDLDYFNKSASTVVSFSDHSQINLSLGSAGAVAIVHDPYTGVSETVQHDPTQVLNYARVTPPLTTVVGSIEPIPCHVGANRVDEIRAIVQNTYDKWYSSMYETMVQMERMPFVRLNDMINIVIRPDQSRSAPWSGLYSVTQAKHTVVKGSLTSEFTLQRGEQTSLGRNFQKLQSLGIADLVVKENLAVGQPVNINEARSSKSISTNTERGFGGEIYKVVQKP